VAQLA